MAESFDLDRAIRRVPDFPKPGILFYDITSVIANPGAFRYCIDAMARLYADKGIEAIAAIESRGFIFGAALADRLGIPLLLARKKGKLPGATLSASYALEYGTAEIEMHVTDIPKGQSVLIVDDLIATGGTVGAVADLLRRGGARPVGAFAVIGLPFLSYQKTVGDLEIQTLIEFHGE